MVVANRPIAFYTDPNTMAGTAPMGYPFQVPGNPHGQAYYPGGGNQAYGGHPTYFPGPNDVEGPPTNGTTHASFVAQSGSLVNLMASAKRGDFNAQDYGSFRPHLAPYVGVSMNHFHGGMMEASAATYGQPHAIAQVHALPEMSGLSSKTELTYMEGLIDEMTQACYRTTALSPTTDTTHIGTVDVQTSVAHRYTHSPPIPLPHAHNHLAANETLTTPDLTSDSSVTSSHSPMSTQDLSPIPHSLYPALPSSMSNSQAHLPPSVSTSTLGPQYAPDARHRHSSGLLQRAAPAHSHLGFDTPHSLRSEAMDFEMSTKPAGKRVSRAIATSPSNDANIDPALGGPVDSTLTMTETEPIDEAETSESEATILGEPLDALYFAHLKFLEALKEALQAKLRHGHYTESESHDGPDSTYPPLMK